MAALSTLRPGQVARVIRVEGDDSVAQRLTDLGFWPGTTVVVVRRAPFGDPTQYTLRGYRLALRSGEACRVVVEVSEESP
jgi:Fe2+ transport system protein FeoA